MADRPAGASGVIRTGGRLWHHGAGQLVSRSGHMEYDRILFFTDAVFAIAITLLIVDLPVQIEHMASGHTHEIKAVKELHQDASGIAGFALSFAVIALFWMAHHATFRYITTIDRTLMRLNLLFIGVIAFLPYPTQLLSSVSLSTGQVAGVVFYAICAGTAGLLETLTWIYASAAGLTEGVSPHTQVLFALRAARIPLVFAASIPVAFVWGPTAGTYAWIGIPVLGYALNRAYGQHEPRQPLDEPDATDSPDVGEAEQAPSGSPEPPASPAGPDGESE
jgi:uncharacterized membrane protein